MKRRSKPLLGGSISDSLGPSASKRSKGESNTEKEQADVEPCLGYLQSLFPAGVFDLLTPGAHPLPPIVLRHQLYSVIRDRTTVDRQIVSLRDSGSVRVLKLGVAEDDYGLVKEVNYVSYIRHLLGDGLLSQKVTGSLLQHCHDVSVSREMLSGDLRFTEDEISSLVSQGVLLVRDVGKTGGSWWFALPGISSFIKSLTRGRDKLQQIIGRSKFKEMLHRDLVSRKMSVSKLPIEYHIHDLIGADIVERVETTSGDLLKLVEH